MNSETVKPLPCPVCGNEPDILIENNFRWKVLCQRIFHEDYADTMKHTIGTFDDYDSKEEAIENWNAIVNATRAATIQTIEPKVIFNERGI